MSRSTPPLPVARLRASGNVSEIRTEALRFTFVESEQFLRARMRLALDAPDLAFLEERAEGWIAGLHLAALLFRDGELTQGVAVFTGTQHALLDYVREEILAPLPEDIQTFLLATSLFEHFHAPLCAAVTGREHPDSLLEQLAQTRLLLLPSEEQTGWYRLPHLWAEALRYHLELTQPALAATLHTRASRWFEEQGMVEKAIEHAFAAHNEERANADRV